MIESASQIAYVIIASGLLLAIVRLNKGPDPVDRVLCLDFLSVSAAALIAVQAIWSGDDFWLDVVLILSVIAFLGTITFARYIEGFIKEDQS